MKSNLLGWWPERRSRESLQQELEAWVAAELESVPAAAIAGTGRPVAPSDHALAWVCDVLQPRLLDLWNERNAHREELAQLQSILQSADGAILAVTGDYRRVYANAAADILFSPGGGATGEHVVGLQRYPLLLQWISAVAAGEPPISSRLLLPDDRTLQVYVTPLTSLTPGGLPGCVVVARDITETVRLEATRRDFIAALSHELRTPLTSIQGYAELLQQQSDLPQETRDGFLAVMLQNTRRLSRMAADLVTLSSLETGTYPFHFRSVNPAELIAPALDVIEPLVRERNCRISVGPLENATVNADPEALHRVLLNLLENAVIHGSRVPGGADKGLVVTVSGYRQAGEYVLSVHDSGVGISSVDSPRVFERFYRVEKSHNSAVPGTGLGLALVKHIAREHGGRVQLDSALGQGSTFRVFLPLVSASDSISSSSAGTRTSDTAALHSGATSINGNFA